MGLNEGKYLHFTLPIMGKMRVRNKYFFIVNIAIILN